MGTFSSLYLGFHRTSVQLSLPTDKVEKLFFSENDFSKIKWLEKDQELEWCGKLYDVSNIVKKGSGFEIFCTNDSEEESIVAIFKEWKKSNLPVNKTKTQLQPLFCNSIFSFEKQIPTKRFYQPKSISFFDSSFASVFSPPPES